MRPSPQINRVLRWFPIVAGVYAAAVGVMAVLGWLFNLPLLADWDRDGIAMQPNTGITAVAAGVGLACTSFSQRKLAAAIGVLVLAIGGMALVQNCFSLPPSFIDEALLFGRPWGSRGTLVPGRMGVPASLAWLLCGTALLLLLRQRPTSAVVPALGLLMICSAGLSLVGYLFGADPLYALPKATAIAMQTATIVLILGIGLVAAAPDRQPMRILAGQAAGSVLARRALGIVLAVPILLGYLSVRGLKLHFYDNSMGMALLVLSLIITLCAVLWWCVAEANRREESQRQSDERFGLFMKHLPGLAWIKDQAGRYLYINDAAEGVFGVSRELIRGKSDDDVFPDSTARQFQTNDQLALNEGKGVQVIETLLHDDGLLHHSIVSKFPLQSGRTPLIGGIAIDITARMRAEETVGSLLRIGKRLNSTLDVDQLLDSLVVEVLALIGAEAGVAGLLTAAGMTCKRYFRHGVVIPLDYCWPPGHGLPGWLIEHKSTYVTNDAASDPQIVEELCERFGVWSAMSTPIMTAQGEVLGFFEIHNKQSGTEFTLTDRELVESVAQLAAIAIQNALAYRSLQDARAELEQNDRRKDEFLAVLAHELRNPLAPIRTGLEILNISLGDNADLRKTHDAMQRQVTSLVRLVDDLLDLSRIRSDKLELRAERIELAAMIRQAVETAQPLAVQQDQHIRQIVPPEPLVLLADPIRLTQVFSNLLNNACKYSPAGSDISIAARRDGSDVLVSVRDQGLGIPADRIGEIFEMFTQIHRTFERSSEGLGIGLTLVRRLVEMHGGTVAAFSEGPHRGSEFVVRLPLAPVESQDAGGESPTPSAVPGAARRVLVVDDNRDAATTLGTLLTISGHEVTLAHDGIEACEIAQKFRPRVILLDLGMPRMDGYEACRRIRAMSGGDDVAIVALTGWGDDEIHQQTKLAGFDDHLVKPVDYQDLLQILDRLATDPCTTLRGMRTQFPPL